MSILIKGIAMPPTCQCCVFYYSAEFDDPALRAMLNNRCVLTNKYTDDPARKRNGDCPLAEIPPHGRLIDADALEEYCKRQVRDEWNQKAGTSWSYAFAEFENIVHDRDTIIEAEGGERE